MSHDPSVFRVVSVNLSKRHSALLSLLSTSTVDCLLIQEPLWTISTPLCSDSDPDGVARHRAIHHPTWSSLAPPPPYVVTNHGPHVMIYWRRSLPFSFSLAPIPQFYFLLCIDVTTLGFSIWLVNFYHHVPHWGHGLHRLLDFDLSPTTLCLVAGDFNSHSRV